MKNILRRLHLVGTVDDSITSDQSKSSTTPHILPLSEGYYGSSILASQDQDRKPFSRLANLITAAKNSLSSLSTGPSTGPKGRKEEANNSSEHELVESKGTTREDFHTVQTAESGTDTVNDIWSNDRPFGLMTKGLSALSLDDVEESEVRVAMALSVRDDLDKAAIEQAKQIGLVSDQASKSTSAEELAFKYWKYGALDYGDKVVDGFYDVYGVIAGKDASSETMPSLINLQETPVSNEMTLEVVLVNRATDPELVNLEQKALTLSLDCEASIVGLENRGLIQKIAYIVVNQMGGVVSDADLLLKRWQVNNMEIQTALGSVVLPLGQLQVGLARHRALLFKVLADVVGIPCQLVKRHQYTGSDTESFNIVNFNDGRVFIIDLMGDPGSLMPSDVSGLVSLPVVGTSIGTHAMMLRDSDKSVIIKADYEDSALKSQSHEVPSEVESQLARYAVKDGEENSANVCQYPQRLTRHSRSPSWTEGVGSSAVNMKAKDGSQYMMDAAKDNSKLAQKLHDVLLESGVQAPLDLFTEVSSKQLQDQITDDVKFLEEKQKRIAEKGVAVPRKEVSTVGLGRTPGRESMQSSHMSSDDSCKGGLHHLNSVEGLVEKRPLEANLSPCLPPSSAALSGAATQTSVSVLPSAAAINIVQENLVPEIIKHVPVAAAAAAAATAAVVASSMVVAAANSDIADPVLDVPVAAAATATAAAVVATSAVIGKDDQVLVNVTGKGSGGKKYLENVQNPNESGGSVSARVSPILDDVPEIPWEDLILGERIGLGSYGEVYRGEWHGTEVAVKKFFNQDISADALEEFGKEVCLMKRMRHPNVVLLMGAVMCPPNLSIVTEFLPRGSLYRLIHRPNNQLDERRRVRMALDVARGMNYLHSSTPVIVHRDLKSPNLLVDKNWVVKVCDFGLSRMKYNTFLSSKSTAGTPEWMAPEVLRNEPSNEKSDVYSFGVILWELATLQQPWAGMNSMQVVGAVGFQHRCLDIPQYLDPTIAAIIRQCWRSDPNSRPSFCEILEALKPLQRPQAAAQQLQASKS